MAEQSEYAAELYNRNYNCAQSVLCSFCRETGMDEEQAKRIASSFGHGMGSLKEVCGALTGAFMALGLLKGFTDPTSENKRNYALLVDELALEFHNRFGVIRCRDLLQRNNDDGSAKTEPKPCLKYVVAAAKLVEKRL
jgi:C_GCAxxG_C_C family probable redox protein